MALHLTDKAVVNTGFAVSFPPMPSFLKCYYFVDLILLGCWIYRNASNKRPGAYLI